jgi:hypothetical protein
MHTPSQASTPHTLRALRVNDFCRDYGLSRTSFYKLVGAGKLTTVKVAGRRLVPVEAAEALLKAEV